MARPYRIEAENTFYHLTNRGDDRKKIYASEYDYEKFLEYVLKAKERYNFRLYAYVLMTNHYHLLIKTLEANISKIMHYINSAYTTYYNIKRKKTGHLFQGRYKALVVDADSYFLKLTRYIHRNPVKAKIVNLPEEYKWSSYRGYIGKEKDKYIDKKEIKEITNLLGSRYRDFVMSTNEEESDPFKNIYGGILLGGEKFIKEKLKGLKEQIENKEGAYKKRLRSKVESEEIIRFITKKYNTSLEELSKRTRNNQMRNIGIYLIKVLTGQTNQEIGNIFGMNFSAVSKAGLLIEKEMEANKKLKKEIKSLISNFEG